MHARTVEEVFKVSRTRADSVEARGVRSGMVMDWGRMQGSERRFAHQGIERKWEIGSVMDWLWVVGGFVMVKSRYVL